MTTDGWSDDSERLANWDQKAEQQWARELQELDRKAEAAAEKVEMQRYLAVDIEPPTLQEIRDYNETGLLGAAMVSDEALPALQTVGTSSRMSSTRMSARQSWTRQRTARRMTLRLSPRSAGARPAHDRDRPGVSDANRGAVGVRSWRVGERGKPGRRQRTGSGYATGHPRPLPGRRGRTSSASAREALEAGEDPGLAFARTANDLVGMPAKLDMDLREVRNTATLEAVDTRKPRPVTLASEATTPHLGLPARPATMNLRAVASA